MASTHMRNASEHLRERVELLSSCVKLVAGTCAVRPANTVQPNERTKRKRGDPLRSNIADTEADLVMSSQQQGSEAETHSEQRIQNGQQTLPGRQRDCKPWPRQRKAPHTTADRHHEGVT
jgi:hypothetical protein